MVWVPGAAAAYPVRRSDAWLGPGPGMILPVAVDPAEPERITLIDDRDALADGPHLSGPSEAEIECPPPTVAELLDAVRDAGHGVFPDERHFTSLTDLQWAVALRLGQLSLHEAHRISVLGAASDVVALRERLETVGPVGSPLIHRPSAVEDALAHLPRGVIGAGGLAGSFAAFAAVTRLEARGLRGRLLGRTDPADLTAALAPFVTVCGPIPGVDVVPLAAPSLPEPAARTPMARGAAGPGTTTAPGSADRALWDAALVQHDRILAAYLRYETDPELRLRFPAIGDVRRPPTAAFHEALAVAQSLRADLGPSGPDHAYAYSRAVRETARLWALCERNGHREARGAP